MSTNRANGIWAEARMDKGFAADLIEIHPVALRQQIEWAMSNILANAARMSVNPANAGSPAGGKP